MSTQEGERPREPRLGQPLSTSQNKFPRHRSRCDYRFIPGKTNPPSRSRLVGTLALPAREGERSR